MRKIEKVKQYIQQNPSATAAVVSKKFKISASYVYVIRSQMNKAVKKVTASAKPEVVAAPSIEMFEAPHDPVTRPAHYTDGGIETIDFIEAKGLGYHLGNAVKYISRAGKKGTNNGLEDLKKAQWYLARAIEKNEFSNPMR